MQGEETWLWNMATKIPGHSGVELGREGFGEEPTSAGYNEVKSICSLAVLIRVGNFQVRT